jgi:hypothetical protein
MIYVAEIFIPQVSASRTITPRDHVAIRRVLLDKLRQVVVLRRPLLVYYLHDTGADDKVGTRVSSLRVPDADDDDVLGLRDLVTQMSADMFLPTTTEHLARNTIAPDPITGKRAQKGRYRVFCHCTRNLAQDGHYKVEVTAPATYSSEFYRMIHEALRENMSVQRALRDIIARKGVRYVL